MLNLWSVRLWRSTYCASWYRTVESLTWSSFFYASHLFCRSKDVLVILSRSVLEHDSAKNAGDLYIRSVCFSPDGKFLATGAEDRIIRVSLLPFLSFV